VKSPVALHIDRIACDGRGMCAELLPELITLDDWGYPIIADRPVPRDLESLAHAAVEVCPKMALQLRVSEKQGSPASGSDSELRAIRNPAWGYRDLSGRLVPSLSQKPVDAPYLGDGITR